LVIGDTTRLTQVVANLLQNACKYTPRGGQIAVSATTESTYATVRVRDNGIGIPSEFLPHIFEKFSQVASAINRSEGGLGLGLALVRGIVTRHGGTVAVHSDGAHGGSEFVIRIPLVTEARISPAATVSPQLPVVETCGTSRRVLVADDNVDNTDALAMLLRLRGHQVETALDGEAAFVTAERFRPDVALLDIGMPKMNGYELCRRIRQQTWGRGMRLIAQTGWGQLHDRRRSQEAGFDGHLVKPVDPATLDAIIQG
jgi:CheY-like chemotaxis protein